MKLSQLDKVKQAYEKLQKLDAEIIAIEKLANDIVNKKTKIQLKLSVVDLEKNEKAKFDEDGSLIDSNRDFGLSSYLFMPRRQIYDGENTEEPKQNKDAIKEVITDTDAMQILGLLIRQKQEKRAAILRIFERWGIEI